MIKRIIAAMTAALLIGGCSTLQIGSKDPLNGEWKSLSSSATIRFDNGRMSGSDGCNRFGSAYVSSGDTLMISDKMMSTMMACEPERMKSADQFRHVLILSKRYRLGEKTLTLLGTSGEILGEFVRIEKQP
ncbi:MAG: hypothetical protein A3D90_03975 [Sulfuricurvum sp. RIFCSPHIGHO2_02_FULL_43_9]|nr:MAG: hypothetical protein A3D90_03975 [Sulfuricurvum sp. RIFCSPHIGHO2_02_FULL_43_9]